MEHAPSCPPGAAPLKVSLFRKSIRAVSSITSNARSWMRSRGLLMRSGAEPTGPVTFARRLPPISSDTGFSHRLFVKPFPQPPKIWGLMQIRE